MAHCRTRYAASLVYLGTALHDKAGRGNAGYGPFEHLTGGIEKAERAPARGKETYGCRVERPCIVTVETELFERVAPGETAPFGSARCLFPFRLARKAPFPPRRAQQPCRIGERVGMLDELEGMPVPAPRGHVAGPRMVAGSLPRIDQTLGSPRLAIDVGRSVPRRADQGAVLSVRDRRDGDVEGGHRAHRARPLARAPAIASRVTMTVGRLVKQVGRLALGAVKTLREGSGRHAHGFGNGVGLDRSRPKRGGR